MSGLDTVSGLGLGIVGGLLSEKAWWGLGLCVAVFAVGALWNLGGIARRLAGWWGVAAVAGALLIVGGAVAGAFRRQPAPEGRRRRTAKHARVFGMPGGRKPWGRRDG